MADAPDLGSGVYDVQVQVLSSAPSRASARNSRVGLFFYPKISVRNEDNLFSN